MKVSGPTRAGRRNKPDAETTMHWVRGPRKKNGIGGQCERARIRGGPRALFNQVVAVTDLVVDRGIRSLKTGAADTTGAQEMRAWWARRGLQTLVASSALLALAGGAWWLADSDPIEKLADQSPSVEVPLHRGARVKPAVGATIVVTMRWGHTDGSATTHVAATDDSPVVWDGFLALDCGEISKVEGLYLELDDPASEEVRPHADFLGPVVRGDRGDQRVYWRSKTQRSWDGLKAHIVACDPEPGDPNGTGSTLAIRTRQRAYTARLDWSANDFVSLDVDRAGQALEVHINAEFDERAMAGARITEAEPAQGGESLAR